MKYVAVILLAFSVYVSSFVSAQEIDFLGSRKVYSDLHLDMVGVIDDLKLGYTPASLTITNEDETPDNICVALAMELSMDALNNYYFVEGFKVSTAMTAEIMSPLLGLIGADKAVDLGKMMLESADSEEFLEEVNKYVAGKIIDKGVDAVIGGLKEMASDELEELVNSLPDELEADDITDLLSDEAKESLKDAYNKLHESDGKPDIEFHYDPGKTNYGFLDNIIEFFSSSKTICPVYGAGSIVRNPEDGRSYLKIAMGGYCMCRWPAATQPKLYSFENIIFIRLNFEYNNDQEKYIFFPDSIFYEVQADCECPTDTEDCSWLDPDEESILTGFNGGFGFDKREEFSYRNSSFGLEATYAINNSFGVGLNLGTRTIKQSYEDAFDRERYYVLSPHITYYQGLCRAKPFAPYVSLRGELGTGKLASSYDGEESDIADLSIKAISLNPGIAWKFGPRASLHADTEIFRWQVTNTDYYTAKSNDGVTTWRYGLRSSSIQLRLILHF